MKKGTAALVLTLALGTALAGCSSQKSPKGEIKTVTAAVPSGVLPVAYDADIKIDPEYLKPYPDGEEIEEDDTVKYDDEGNIVLDGPFKDLDDNVLIVLANEFIDEEYLYYPAYKIAEESFFLGTEDAYFYRGFVAIKESETTISMRYNIIATVDLIEKTVVRNFDYEKIEDDKKITYKVKGNDDLILEFDKQIGVFRYYYDIVK